MQTTDLNGLHLQRGDLVVLSDAMQLDNPIDRQLGIGQIEHIFTEGKNAGIHIRFAAGIRCANTGFALVKVDPNSLCN